MTGDDSRVTTTTAELPAEIERLLALGFRPALVAAHDDGPTLRVVYLMLAPGSRREITLMMPKTDPHVPSLAGISFPIGRFEREMRDLYGIKPYGHPLPRRLVRHGNWPRGWYPMRRDATPPEVFPEPTADPYPFTPVEGTGVYEIPVGPVHAGLIEPGHFRFSVVGETIIRMKARLWFVHKGIEKLFEGRTVASGIALAERISGDTAVGHSLAYIQAVEEATGITVTPDVQIVRAALLEMERLYNHVGDVGALCNDVGYGAFNQQALAIKEQLLRLNQSVTGHRLLRGAITPSAVSIRNVPDLNLLNRIASDMTELADIALSNSVVRDRFTSTSILAPDAALTMGVLGPVARASGVHTDARMDHPTVDLTQWIRPFSNTTGDVLARFRIRVHECLDSIAILNALTPRIGNTAPTSPLTNSSDQRQTTAGYGIVEGWRGTIAHRVELDRDGLIARAKIVDPSFFNWPALPIAMNNTIVPDFPLTNKSFNLSYAGNDL